VRVIASKNRFVFGMYRRHMKTISYLNQIDRLFSVPATTRNWNTILAIVRIVKGQGKKGSWQAVLFLLSDECPFMTGALVSADGGYTCQ
jgi:hypothetical protein